VDLETAASRQVTKVKPTVTDNACVIRIISDALPTCTLSPVKNSLVVRSTQQQAGIRLRPPPGRWYAGRLTLRKDF